MTTQLLTEAIHILSAHIQTHTVLFYRRPATISLSGHSSFFLHSRYIPFFIILTLYFSGCFTKAKKQESMPVSGWLLLGPSALYYWCVTTESLFILYWHKMVLLTCIRTDGSKWSQIKVLSPVIPLGTCPYWTTSPTHRYVPKEGAIYQLELVHMRTSLTMLQRRSKCQTSPHKESISILLKQHSDTVMQHRKSMFPHWHKTFFGGFLSATAQLSFGRS